MVLYCIILELSGELLQLQGRAVLLRHLEAKGTPQGMPALAECVALRFGGEEQALRALKDFKEVGQRREHLKIT